MTEMKKIKFKINSYYCRGDSCGCHVRCIRSAGFTE